MINSWRTVLLGSVLFAASLGVASADEARKIPKIGQVFGTNPSIAKPYDEAFREGLRSLGYIDGRNIVFLPRYAQGDPNQFPNIISELIASNVDVLVVAITAIPAALKTTRTIPIVAGSLGGSPVEAGYVSSLAHPGGNITGGGGFGPEQSSKFMQFAMEVVPNLKRVGLIYESISAEFARGASEAREQAQGMGVSMHTVGVQNLGDIRNAFTALEKQRVQALIVWGTPLMILHRDIIMGFASHKIPVIAQSFEQAAAGALITYAPSGIEQFRRAAVYVDKILKGANPGDLPIERPTKYELRVNLKTARDLGITIPESILLQADEIIR